MVVLMETNQVLDKLPKHLLSLIIDQPYSAYTAEDHAVWRYVMRQNVEHLAGVAHHSYLEGLKRTGIYVDAIPHMYGMNRILSDIGWAAVAVDGFIPPAAFMEFQAHNVLVIAADIRPVDQILYTPAPDIIHEAAGHAPIIADAEYAAYLRLFGYYGSKAFSSKNDYHIYEAIRHLSILKADPYTPADNIKKAELDLGRLDQKMNEPSEMAQLRNLHWWTVEYGLIGELSKPKIYGAGLLSSIGESHNCMQPHVQKLPYSIDALRYNFDITRQQPQLFVTPDFAKLTDVLEEFASSMALKTGGVSGLLKAVNSGSAATAVYSSGLQVCGTINQVLSVDGDVEYIRTAGPTMLCFNGKMIPGHGCDYHSGGFGSPVGKLRYNQYPLESLSDSELTNSGIIIGQSIVLEFESGVRVFGLLNSLTRREGKLILMTFDQCLVTLRDHALFLPAWGLYDMAVGWEITSVYSGPADPEAFGLSYPVPAEKTHKIHYTPHAFRLHELYTKLVAIRKHEYSHEIVEELWKVLIADYPDEWLPALEIYEILLTNDHKVLASEIRSHLEQISRQTPELHKLINDGIQLLHPDLHTELYSK
jgi:phenylalanine-4-hydroxylase